AANADHGNAASELCKAFLQLLAVVVRGGFLDLRLDLANATLDVFRRTGTVDDGRVFLGDFNALGGAEHVDGHVLELEAEIFRDHLATGQDGDVFEHCLAAIAEARSLDGSNLEATAQTVDDEGRESLTFNVFGNDQQRTL